MVYSRYSKRRYSGASSRRALRRPRRIPSASRRKLRAIANLRTGGTAGIELKFFETAKTGFAVTNLSGQTTVDMASISPVVANCYFLNNPNVGSAATQRDGRVIRARSIEVEGVLRLHCTAVAATNYRNPTVWVMLCLDTQVNNTAITPATYGNKVYVEHAPGAPMRNLDGSPRFRVLAATRKQFNCQLYAYDQASATSPASGFQQLPFKLYRKLGFKTNYTVGAGGSTLGSDIVDNGLFVMIFSDRATAAGVDLKADLASRLRFVG